MVYMCLLAVPARISDSTFHSLVQGNTLNKTPGTTQLRKMSYDAASLLQLIFHMS
jgi:hypothetical protein